MKSTIPTKEQLDNLLNRGISDVIVRDELEARLKKGERLRIYHGIDPTGSQLHLGHAVVLRKLEQFRQLGHELILLIGDFTAQIGDPTGKTTARVPLTHEQVLANAKDYQKQASGILDFSNKKNPIRLKFNSEWLSKLSFKDVLQLGMQFTVQQMVERDMFQERLKNQQPIGLHEFWYPVMQGYDSVAMDVDMEIGGNDQLFNMLAGRTLMKSLKNKSKLVMTTGILEGLDGRKMSKTFDNFVAITAEPSDMFGKIMSMRDELITKYFELATDLPLAEIAELSRQMKSGANPRDIKLKLAKEIVTMYHGAKEADKAHENFLNVFQKKELPAEIAELRVTKGEHQLMDLLVSLELAASKSEAKRVIEQKGVKVDGQVVSEPFAMIKIGATPVLLQKGKLKYVNVIGK